MIPQAPTTRQLPRSVRCDMVLTGCRRARFGMKPYIIAGLLFVTGLLVLGVATATLMSPSDQKPKPHAAAPTPEPRKAVSSNPTDATYPAATPTGSSAGASRMTPGM